MLNVANTVKHAETPTIVFIAFLQITAPNSIYRNEHNCTLSQNL